jgi:predicted nucleotidyltransferase
LRELALHGDALSTLSITVRSGLAKASVAKSIRTLESFRIVETLGVARSRLHRLRRDHPLSTPLQALFKNEAQRFDRILSLIGQAAVSDGVLAVWIYGSAARGDDIASSDVDIVIAANPKNEDTSTILGDALVAVGEFESFYPSLIVVDAEDIKRLSGAKDPWWRNLVSNALVVRGDRPELLAQRLASTGRGAKRISE